MSSLWLPQCKSVKKHYFIFNDNVIELKEPWIRNQGKKKREKKEKKNPTLVSGLLFPSPAVCPRASHDPFLILSDSGLVLMKPNSQGFGDY